MPLLVVALIAVHCMLATGGLYGGATMLIDPSGHLLQMREDVLGRIGFLEDYTLPGVFLITFMGILPICTVVALVRRPDSNLLSALNFIKQQHWAWTMSFGVGMVLCGWMSFQLFLIGYIHPVQGFSVGMGVSITGLTLLPPVMKYYRQ